jgi:hypothetical protein
VPLTPAPEPTKSQRQGTKAPTKTP